MNYGTLLDPSKDLTTVPEWNDMSWTDQNGTPTINDAGNPQEQTTDSTNDKTAQEEPG